jgi:hypothetical protein
LHREFQEHTSFTLRRLAMDLGSIFSGVGVTSFGALWRWLKKQRRPKEVTSPTPTQTTTTAPIGGMAVGGNVTATAQSGGTVIVGPNKADAGDDSASIASLKALSKRLLSQLLTLPPSRPANDRDIRSAVLWVDEELQRLEKLAESSDEATIASVSGLVMHLRFIRKIVEEVQRVNPKMGYDYDKQWPQQRWEESFQEARSALQNLVGSEKRPVYD